VATLAEGWWWLLSRLSLQQTAAARLATAHREDTHFKRASGLEAAEAGFGKHLVPGPRVRQMKERTEIPITPRL